MPAVVAAEKAPGSSRFFSPSDSLVRRQLGTVCTRMAWDLDPAAFLHDGSRTSKPRAKVLVERETRGQKHGPGVWPLPPAPPGCLCL